MAELAIRISRQIRGRAPIREMSSSSAWTPADRPVHRVVVEPPHGGHERGRALIALGAGHSPVLGLEGVEDLQGVLGQLLPEPAFLVGRSG